ncbi:MAG: amylo-alpha-1,6-glucosidase [Candidatus Methylomirabilis sp.]|nr:amylo-alpha-1,6-glucosidase [Candidatus Methylomirabilis sp.]
MIEFGEAICSNLTAALHREWLETNGLGGFASSTIIGLNTRRYHGLLIAATKPPVGRLALLSKLEEVCIINGRRFELSANQYPGAVHPQGYQYLRRFRLDPFPIFTYVIEGIEIQKSVFMIHGENSTIIQYELRSATRNPGHLPLVTDHYFIEVRPLIAFRDYHVTTHENDALNPQVQVAADGAVVTPYDSLPALHVAYDADELDATGHWYRNFEYEAERERGLDFREDLFSPFALRWDLSRRAEATIIASTEPHDVRSAAEHRLAQIARRGKLLATVPSRDGLVQTLAAAADHFIVKRGNDRTVIAGYPWFTDWGRDTMIALPGLTLVTGRADVAKSILLAFARETDHGLLPNRFPDAGQAPEYNTVDASLWLFEAVRALLHYTGDLAFIKLHLYDLLGDIIAWHLRGTRYGIRIDDDGLLTCGEPGVQLTWMDAKAGDFMVTARPGKAVEIQALWYNALGVVAQLAQALGDPANATQCREMATLTRHSFNRLFWNETAGCLYDVVDKDASDAAIRPNQILAVSLPHTMLAADRAKGIVDLVEREPLTPYGLRSLAPSDPHYRGRYEGDQYSRDGAYHQGTVWPWLMGPFITAYIKVNGGTKEAREQAAAWLAPFRAHLREAGLGQVSEIFDGDPPHRPRGCIAQAWSVAELLRAAVEDVSELWYTLTGS